MLALFNIEAIALILYFLRDTFAGALRFYLDGLRLGPLWFIPDLLALVCIGVFVQRSVLAEKSAVATGTFFVLLFSIAISYVFFGNVTAVMSAIKMIAPIFVGFCFCGRNFSDYVWTRRIIHVILYISIAGIIASSYVTFPWVGYSYESFGAVREATRLWWTASDVRLAGFAADSTMAAYFVLLAFVITSLRQRLWWIAVWGAIGIYAIKLTTSKTCLIVLIVYLVVLPLVRTFRKPLDFLVLRKLASGSFLAILIPVVLVVGLSGVDLTEIDPTLFSMQDRINNAWQSPFINMLHLMPTGYVTGCGLGCFNYPQQLFAPELAEFYFPVDNFYVGTYLMFGLPFVAFVICVVQAMKWTDDVYKLTIVFVMNIFTITVLSYGPASGLLMIGFGFSEVFARPRKNVASARAITMPDLLAEAPHAGTGLALRPG